MKGHMEKDGFHPHTEYKGVRKSRDQTAKLEGVRLKRSDGSRIKKLEFKVWKFEDASEDLQEKILENLRQRKYDYADDWFADYDGIIYDKKTQIADYDVFSNYGKKYYDLDRGQYIQFPDLEIKDEKKLAKMLGIPESLRKKIDFNFVSQDETNTKLIFIDSGYNGNEIDLDESYETYKEPEYADIHYRSDEKPMSEREYNILRNVSEKWDDMMSNAWSSLRDNYEHQFTDEALKEDAIANDYEFNEDGDIV